MFKYNKYMKLKYSLFDNDILLLKLEVSLNKNKKSDTQFFKYSNV